jgi:lipopolysaccharide transport system permease protein
MKNTFFDIFHGLTLWKTWITLAKFDLIKKYKRSFLGPWWITVTTLILILSISFIYSGLFKIDLDKYLLTLSLNFIIWFFIKDSIVESCNALIDSKSFILNEKLNLIVLSLRVICRNFLIFLHNILIFIIILFYFGFNFSYLYLLFSLFSFLLLLAFLFPICISLSLICTRFRDVQMIINNLMQFLFFVSPILFTKTALLNFEWIILINPIALFLLCISEPINLGNINFLYLQILSLYFLAVYVALFFIYNKYKSKILYWL